MKAAYIEQFGGAGGHEYGDLPDPSAGPGQIVVDAFAASVNGADWKVRAGHHGQQKFPLVLGRDFSGVVRRWAKASRICASAMKCSVFWSRAGKGPMPKKSPSAHPSSRRSQRHVACRRRGSGADRTHRSVFGRGLVETEVRRDDPDPRRRRRRCQLRHPACQAIGARVITTASAANLSYLRDIGADQVIDYNTTDFTKVVSNCDAVFDTVGGDVAMRSFAVLKPGGRAAFIASGAKAPTPDRSDVTALRPAVGRDRPHLERIAALYQAGVIRPARGHALQIVRSRRSPRG